MSGTLQTSFDVSVEGDTFTFKMPTIKFEIETSYRAADVRRRAYPEANGGLATADWQMVRFSRYCAILELYLLRATTLWPYGYATDDDLAKIDFAKPPAVDFEKFPAECSDLVFLVGEAFEAEMQRFRRRRNPAVGSTGAEAVVSQ